MSASSQVSLPSEGGRSSSSPTPHPRLGLGLWPRLGAWASFGEGAGRMQGGAPFPLTNSLFRPPLSTSPRSHASGTAFRMGGILRGSLCLGSERVKKQTILSPWEGGEGLSLSVLFGELCSVGWKEVKGDLGASCRWVGDRELAPSGAAAC